MNATSRRTFPTWLLLVWAFLAGGAGPLLLCNLMQREKGGALAALDRSTEALRNLHAACDRRDAAYRNKSDAQDGLIAEMQKGLDVRDQLLAAKGAL